SDLWIRKPAADRRLEQLVVGNAAPEEQRETRRERNVVERIRLAGRCPRRRCARRPEEKLRTAQDARERELDASLEIAAVAAAFTIDLEQRRDIVLPQRTAVRAACKAREDRLGAVEVR